MPRQRSPDSIEAEKLFKAGMPLVEIAKKINVPAGTVRRWKSTQGWQLSDKKKQSERSETNNKIKSERSVLKPSARKRGGQTSNSNAKGHGAPKENKNALKHGGYVPVIWDKLSDDEKELFESIPDESESHLIEEIKFYSIRERRLLEALNQLQSEAKKGIYLSAITKAETKRSFKTKEEEQLYNDRIEKKVRRGERLPGKEFMVTTITASAIDPMLRIERELTAVQSKKAKAIEMLEKIRLEKKAINMESMGNEVVDAWITVVTEEKNEQQED